MTEPVPGFPGYFITREGRLYSFRSFSGRIIDEARELRPRAQKSGHLLASLQRDGKSHRVFVHRLVLEAFVGPCPPGHETLHLDGNPTNNNLENLRWGTRLENMADQRRHGVLVAGMRHGQARHSDEVVRRIRELSARGLNQTAVARELGLLQSYVSRVLSGKRRSAS